MVVFGQGIMSNPFGHSALAFSGRGVYSYGTAHQFGSSATKYLQDQSAYRSNILVVLQTTPEQENSMIKSMMSASGSAYSYTENNCATTNIDALAAAGITSWMPNISFLPAAVRDTAWEQPNSQSHFLPVGSVAPSFIQDFDPKY